MGQSPNRAQRWPVYLALALLVAFALLFVLEFLDASAIPAPAPAALSADAYAAEVSALLESADPQHGEQLLTEYECVACHREGAKNGIAPSFEGIAARAASRRPPLSAAAYIYESILHPTAYIVEGFSGAMPQNYPQRLTGNELGDIIAYLLTSEAR